MIKRWPIKAREIGKRKIINNRATLTNSIPKSKTKTRSFLDSIQNSRERKRKKIRRFLLPLITGEEGDKYFEAKSFERRVSTIGKDRIINN